ncbi:MAG TPA: hypothetical protein VG225_17345 [Terracidiphilus sp.]|jgi:hypothetical protein|nr:hypothetical protein [Terracidiphilus sp.]
MAASTVNIADFRCRAVKGHYSHTPLRDGKRPGGLIIVESAFADRDSERGNEALVSENPAVFDIGIAREAQRLRHRVVFRPITIQRRRSNLIRFGEPRVTVMRVDEWRAAEHWSGASDDCDLPPAA